MRCVFKREMCAYFKTPHAYIFIAAYILTFSLLFMEYNIHLESSSLNGVIGRFSIVAIFLLPFLTLGMFTQDRKFGTDKLWASLPLLPWQIVMGKFFAALCALLTATGISLVYPLIISMIGGLAVGEVFSLYLGLALLCAAMISVCMFACSLSESRMSSVLVGMGALLLLLLVDRSAEAVDDQSLREIVSFVSIFDKFQTFERGIVSLSSTLYLCTFAWLFLVFTSMVETFKRSRRRGL